MKVLIAITITAASAATAAASPNWGPAPGAPAWCKGIVEGTSSEPSPSELERTKAADEQGLTSTAQLICNHDPRAGAVPKLDQAVADWNKRLGMTDADWPDVGDWVRAGGVTARASVASKLALSQHDPANQYLTIVNALGDHGTPEYFADAMGAKLGETGRFAIVKLCLQGNGDVEHQLASINVVQWAVCQPLIDTFDQAKLSAELRADTQVTGAVKTLIRMEAWDASQRFAKRATAVKTMFAKDPAYEKLFQIAAAAEKSWHADPDVLTLVAAMDDARVTQSRKATDGCDDNTWKAWQAAVAKVPAKKLGAIVEVSGDPWMQQAIRLVIADTDGYLAALALAQCRTGTKTSDKLSEEIGTVLGRWPGSRGPLSAAHTAIITAGIELDDKSAKLDLAVPNLGFFKGSTGFNPGRYGVASVKAASDGTTLTFAEVPYTNHECTKGHNTGRVTGIHSNGSVMYEYICEAEKTTKGTEAAHAPVTTTTRYATAIAAGTHVLVGDKIVVGVWAKDGTTVLAAFGVAVK